MYRQIVQQLVRLQHELLAALDRSIAVAPVEAVGETFVPTHAVFSQQLAHWPADMVPIPPAAWVEPRKGSVSLRGQTWDYFFHGGEVSLFHRTTRIEVEIGFGAAGECAVSP